MATITKTQGIDVLTHQSVTHPGSIPGGEISVTDDLEVSIVLYHAYVEVPANATPAEFHIQFTPYASGDEGWKTIFRFDTSTTAAPTEALTATEPSGEKSLAVASTTGFSVGDTVYIQDAGTLADSEWGKLENVVSNTSLDLWYGLTTGKDSSDFVSGKIAIVENNLVHHSVNVRPSARLASNA